VLSPLKSTGAVLTLVAPLGTAATAEHDWDCGGAAELVESGTVDEAGGAALLGGITAVVEVAAVTAGA